jgi:hypothetical protein
MNRKENRGQDILWLSTPAVDFFSGWHEAYPKVRIQRQIVYVKPDYWVVFDSIRSPEYIFQVSDILHGVRPFRILGEGRARLEGEPSCLVISAKPDELRRLTTQVDFARKEFTGPENDVMSRERHRLTAMKWRNVGDQRPITFATLLLPFNQGEPPDIKIAPVAVTGDATGQAEAFAVTWKGRTDTLVFNPSAATLTVNGKSVSAPMAAAIGDNWIELPLAKQ